MKKRILFFGDSLTAGYGLAQATNQAFPALIQKKIDAEGINFIAVNAGLSGDTTESGLRRLDHHLQQPVDIFVLELGANDMIRGLSPASSLQNMRRILDKVKMKFPDAPLVLLGMQLPLWVPGERANEFRMVYQTLAEEFKMAFLPFLLEGVAGLKHLNMHDGIHPLAEGYIIIADKVWPVLKPLLK